MRASNPASARSSTRIGTDGGAGEDWETLRSSCQMFNAALQPVFFVRRQLEDEKHQRRHASGDEIVVVLFLDSLKWRPSPFLSGVNGV